MAHWTRNSNFSLPSRQNRKYMRRRVIVRKILPVALGDINGPWATFYTLLSWPFWSEFWFQKPYYSFLTLVEPYKPKHTLPTLSSKHDSMCHGKIYIGQKTRNPELIWHGIPSFQTVPVCHCGLFWTVLPVPRKHSDIWNFHSSLTMNNGKIIWY